MNEAELIRTIRRVVKQEIAQAMLCTITDTDDQNFGTMQRFKNEGKIGTLRQMKPYGFASRPMPDTPSFAMPVNGDPTHLVLLTEFDVKNRPDLELGESAIYAQPLGQQIYLDLLGNINIGSQDADEPLVLGNVLAAFCNQLISILTTAFTAISTGPIAITTTPGNPAPTNPTVIAAMSSAIASLAAAKSQYVTVPLTNFLSLKNYTERGLL